MCAIHLKEKILQTNNLMTFLIPAFYTVTLEVHLLDAALVCFLVGLLHSAQAKTATLAQQKCLTKSRLGGV